MRNGIDHPINASVACNLDKDILLTLLPLFANGDIDGIEWSFDALYDRDTIPDWFYDLLQLYGKNGRLIGHGIFFSLFNGDWTRDQESWLEHLTSMSQRFQFDHISEHFGFTSGAHFHSGAPLSIPMTNATLTLGIDRLKRIYNACMRPVGLENLAFAYQLDDVKRQAEFMDQLLTPINGFLILDIHNLYCQLHNFNVHLDDIINIYPLTKVREIHISGGSWERSTVSSKDIRRDTHDDSVPAEVFTILEKVLPLCPNVKFVVMEQLGTALKDKSSRDKFRSDFQKMKTIISTHTYLSSDQKFGDIPSFKLEEPIKDLNLKMQQRLLSDILEKSENYQIARSKLSKCALANSEWEVEKWDDDMIDTAVKIAKKWAG